MSLSRQSLCRIASVAIVTAAILAWVAFSGETRSAETSGDQLHAGTATAASAAKRSAPASKKPARRSAQSTPRLPLMPKLVPGEIVDDPEPIASEYVMNPVVNAWRVGSHRDYTVVYAGRAGVDPEMGRLIITRERYSRDRPITPTSEQVDVPGAGALRISEAPLGGGVTRSAHHSGEVAFESESGIEGVLDLSIATVALRSAP